MVGYGQHRAVASLHAPVTLGVDVAPEIDNGHALERRTVVVGRDRVGEPVEARRRVEKNRRGTIHSRALGLDGGIVQPFVESGLLAAERILFPFAEARLRMAPSTL